MYGLRVYQVYGYDDAKRSQQPPNDVGDRNLYYHTNEKDEVDTYIQCDNTKHAAAPCNQYFVLPHTEHTIVSANYRIGLLPQWQAIQATATEVVLGFAVNSSDQQGSPYEVQRNTGHRSHEPPDSASSILARKWSFNGASSQEYQQTYFIASTDATGQ